jgi:hypothetical protein
MPANSMTYALPGRTMPARGFRGSLGVVLKDVEREVRNGLKAVMVYHRLLSHTAVSGCFGFRGASA